MGIEFFVFKEVIELTELDSRDLYYMEKRGLFPRRHPSPVGKVRWRGDRIFEWLEKEGMLERKLRKLVPNGVRVTFYTEAKGVTVYLDTYPGLMFRGGSHRRAYRGWHEFLRYHQYLRVIQCPTVGCGVCSTNRRWMNEQGLSWQ